MSFLFNGSTIPLPLQALFSWVSISGQLLRQITFKWGVLPAADAKTILAAATASDGVNVSFQDPLTAASATLKLHCFSADADAALLRGGSPVYAPLTLVLRQAPPPSP